MSKSPDPREKLLADLFHDDWSVGAAGGFARAAASHARRHRRFRQVLVTGAAAAALALVFLLLHPRNPVPATAPGFEVISDDEVIALVKDRPLLILPADDGTKSIVVLDRYEDAE